MTMVMQKKKKNQFKLNNKYIHKVLSDSHKRSTEHEIKNIPACHSKNPT